MSTITENSTSLHHSPPQSPMLQAQLIDSKNNQEELPSKYILQVQVKELKELNKLSSRTIGKK